MVLFCESAHGEDVRLLAREETKLTQRMVEDWKLCQMTRQNPIIDISQSATVSSSCALPVTVQRRSRGGAVAPRFLLCPVEMRKLITFFLVRLLCELGTPPTRA